MRKIFELNEAEIAALEAYRVRFALRSGNAALKHMLAADAAAVVFRPPRSKQQEVIFDGTGHPNLSTRVDIHLAAPVTHAHGSNGGPVTTTVPGNPPADVREADPKDPRDAWSSHFGPARSVPGSRLKTQKGKR